jgi:hypothetical protein
MVYLQVAYLAGILIPLRATATMLGFGSFWMWLGKLSIYLGAVQLIGSWLHSHKTAELVGFIILAVYGLGLLLAVLVKTPEALRTLRTEKKFAVITVYCGGLILTFVAAFLIVTDRSTPWANSINSDACASSGKVASQWADDQKKTTTDKQSADLATYMAGRFANYSKNSTGSLSSAFSMGASGFATVASAYEKQDQQSLALGITVIKASASEIDKICSSQ